MLNIIVYALNDIIHHLITCHHIQPGYKQEIGKLKEVVEKYPIKYFVVYSPEDITEDFDDLLEFAYLLKQHGAIILSIKDDAVISYEMLKSIKKEMENDEEADGDE